MHKAVFLEGSITFALQPDGPMLIKAGESGGGDPTLPDMEFVRTYRNGEKQVYLPGSSLKGVVRAHCERICRTLDSEGRKPENGNPPLADNPLGRGKEYRGLGDMDYNSGEYVREHIKSLEDREKKLGHKDKDSEQAKEIEHRKKTLTATIYKHSSLTSQMFGHTKLAGRVRFQDAYHQPSESDGQEDEEPRLEERNGVAIDRIYGSVAVGPFNYETAVTGNFVTSIWFKNLTLAQLGLLGLALRDLKEGRVAIGFGKSRGLGRVTVNFMDMSLYYPTCTLQNGTLCLLNGTEVVAASELAGVGMFCRDDAYADYGMPTDDSVPMPDGLEYVEGNLLGVRLQATGDAIETIWRNCMPAWKRKVIGA